MTRFSLFRQAHLFFSTFFLAFDSKRVKRLRFQQSIELYTEKHVFVNCRGFSQLNRFMLCSKQIVITNHI